MNRFRRRVWFLPLLTLILLCLTFLVVGLPSAPAAAQSTDQTVITELSDKRTETSNTYLLSDGTYQVESSQPPRLQAPQSRPAPSYPLQLTAPTAPCGAS